MTTIVAAFYADIPDKPSRFDEFLPFILASRRALSITNPDARYTILTDAMTARLFWENDIDYKIVAPSQMPLMCKIVFAQKEFMTRCSDIYDLIVLPDVDCLANRCLDDAIPPEVGFATTHRGRKFEYKINNLAYIRDKKLAYWFFERAYEILKDWPREKQEWEGDQESWQASLAPPLAATSWYDFEDLGNDVFVSKPMGESIHIYPCTTHNCIAPDGGNFQPKHHSAYMVHLKGGRKQHLDKWMIERFGDASDS